jgi:hypothetical protein
MALWNNGSVAAAILTLIDDVPTSVSGAMLISLVDQQIAYVEERTGLTIGTTSIEPKFQSVLIKLTSCNLLSYMETIGADVSSITLGDFSEKRGADSNIMTAGKSLCEQAEKELQAIVVNSGGGCKFYKALG